MKNKFTKFLNKIDTKKFILTSIAIILLIIFVLLAYTIVRSYWQKSRLEESYLSFAEKNKNTIFSIQNIVFFSSSDSKNKTSSKSNFTIENLYTYTDIALFIQSHPNDEDTLENTLKEVSLSNIKFSQPPSIGTPKLYYKDLNKFANSAIDDSNLIDNHLAFSITSEDTADLSIPVLYNNCANPIVLSYVNENVKSDYTITDTSNPITYNGSLLQRCNVPIHSLDCAISMDIYITNNKNQKFKTTIFMNIPYEDEGKSIFDGSITVKKETDFVFYRYE